ncbi:hypothetical protein AWENTII_005251 [Aspergillus wentii]|nr:hypothetical protein MW887_008700 [Aspergillus wentii]
MEEKGFDSQPRSTGTTEEVEYTGPSHKKDHKDDLCKLLSIVWAEDGIIPIALFRESCKPQSEWSWDGELHERRSALWTFPPWLEASLARFEDGSTSSQQWKGCHIENMVFGKGIVIGKECKNINLSGIPYQEQHFNILTIALQALPDQYSEVLWQAKEDQLWDVIETTCLPFLWDIHDLRRWISMSSLPHIPYLLHLTKFLVRVRNRNRHSLRTCPAGHAQEILQILRRETSHYEKADLNYLELAADLCEILSARRRPPLEMLEDVKKLAFDRKDILDRRMVSEIGFTLFDIAKTKNGTGAAMQSWDISWWFSLIQKHPSTMECIAMSLNLPDDALINRLQDWHLNIDAKAVIGMVATTKESHSEAIRILDTAIPDVKARYGVQSIETLVVATALVISCNILLQHDVAERWARVILGQSSRSEKSSADTQHADLEWAKRIVKGETAPARFVHLLTALADFFTCRESYAAAESLLERVITIDTRIKPKTRMITYLMILGMYEKRGDRMEEPKTWKYLQQAVKILKYVSLEQQDKCLEETVRIFLSLDRYNRANLQRAGEILHSLFLATRLRCRNVQRGRLREIAERLNILCLCGSPMMLGQKILDLFPQAHPRIIERISEVSWARGVHIYCSHPSSSSRYIDIDVQSRGFEEPALRPSWTSNPRSLATLLETVQRRCPICKNRFPVGMTKAQKE